MDKKLLRRQFGIWLGFYNAVNQTKYSVKTAAINPDLVKLFIKVKDYICAPQTFQTISGRRATVTSISSYKKLQETDLGAKQMAVFEVIKTQGPLSRKQISRILGMPINTVCGRVHELLEFGLIDKTGTIYDAETDREIEALDLPKSEMA